MFVFPAPLSQTPLPSLKATRVVGGDHRRRHHHHHVILGFSMIGPNETLGPPSLRAPLLVGRAPLLALGWVNFE